MSAAAPALSMTQRDAQQSVSRVLQEAIGYGRSAARALSDTIGCNERAALGWVNGEATPNFVHTLCLIATIPEFAAEVRRLSGMMADMDPETQHAISEFVTRIQRRMALER